MRNRLVALVVGGVLVVAACGGGSTGAATNPAEVPTAEASGPTESVAGSGGEASAEPTVAQPATDAPAPGGGAAGNVCELVTEGELAGIFGTQVSTLVLAGPPDTCDIQSADGAPLAATVFTTSDAFPASAVYDAYLADPSATEINGIGDKAAYSDVAELFLVLKGDKLLSISVFDDGTKDKAARFDLMKQLAQVAAGRM